jgi:hypothetical protein
MARPKIRRRRRRRKAPEPGEAFSEEREQHRAATRLQAVQRGRKSRQRVESLRRERLERQLREAAEEKERLEALRARQFDFVLARASQLARIVVDGPQHFLRVTDPSSFYVDGIRPGLFSPKRKVRRGRKAKQRRVFFPEDGRSSGAGVVVAGDRSVPVDELCNAKGISDGLVEGNRRNVRVKTRARQILVDSRTSARDQYQQDSSEDSLTIDNLLGDEASDTAGVVASSSIEAKKKKEMLHRNLAEREAMEEAAMRKAHRDEVLQEKLFEARIGRRSINRGISREEAERGLTSLPREHERKVLSRSRLKKESARLFDRETKAMEDNAPRGRPEKVRKRSKKGRAKSMSVRPSKK